MRTSKLGSKPFISPSIDALLKPAPTGCAKPTVSKIAVVGALFDREFNIHEDDQATVTRTLSGLQRAGVAVSDMPSFGFYNLLAPLKNDFFHAAFAAESVPSDDLLIVCGVYNSRAPDVLIDRFQPEQQDVPYIHLSQIYQDTDLGYRKNRELSTSPHQKKADSWANGANRLGIKIAVTRGEGHHEICSGSFLYGNFYSVAMPTSAQFETVYGNIPGPLGVVVHKTAVADLKKTVNSEDPLGKRILAL